MYLNILGILWENIIIIIIIIIIIFIIIIIYYYHYYYYKIIRKGKNKNRQNSHTSELLWQGHKVPSHGLTNDYCISLLIKHHSLLWSQLIGLFSAFSLPCHVLTGAIQEIICWGGGHNDTFMIFQSFAIINYNIKFTVKLGKPWTPEIFLECYFVARKKPIGHEKQSKNVN